MVDVQCACMVITMYLLTEWEGWTVKYLTKGHKEWTKHIEVSSP